MPPRSTSPEARDRYWRTYQRKVGEDFDLGGKALAATAAAAMFAPLASKGAVAFPSLPIGIILLAGLVAIGLGIHLQAKVKPDE
jgi:hypothetical protein